MPRFGSHQRSATLPDPGAKSLLAVVVQVPGRAALGLAGLHGRISAVAVRGRFGGSASGVVSGWPAGWCSPV